MISGCVENTKEIPFETVDVGYGGSNIGDNFIISLNETNTDNIIIIASYPTQHTEIKIKKIDQNENILTLTAETKLSESRHIDAEIYHYHTIKIKKSELAQRGNLTFIFVDEKRKGTELHRETVEIL